MISFFKLFITFSVRKSRQKRTKQLNNNNNCSTKKTLKVRIYIHI